LLDKKNKDIKNYSVDLNNPDSPFKLMDDAATSSEAAKGNAQAQDETVGNPIVAAANTTSKEAPPVEPKIGQVPKLAQNAPEPVPPMFGDISKAAPTEGDTKDIQTNQDANAAPLGDALATSSPQPNVVKGKSFMQKMMPWVMGAGAVGSGLAVAGDRTNGPEVAKNFNTAIATRRNQNIEQQRTDIQRKAEQEQAKQNEMVQVPIGRDINGQPIMMGVARKDLGKIGVSSIGAGAKENVAKTAATSREKVAQINQGMPIEVDQTTAESIGHPELTGQKIGLTTYNKLIKSANHAIKDIGGRSYLMNNVTGQKIKDLGESNAVRTAIVRAESFARARAAYSPVTVQDEDGNQFTTSALQALQLGIPTVQKSNGEKVATRLALQNDITTSIGNLKKYTGVLDRGDQERAKLAAVLADPHATTMQFIQSDIAKNFDEDEQNYIINNLNAREQIMGLRKTLGGTGSDMQIAQVLRTIPGASTPSSDYANKQIDTALGVVNRLGKGIPGVQTSRTVNPANKAKPATNSSVPSYDINGNPKKGK
jgi:hypothetical protein